MNRESLRKTQMMVQICQLYYEHNLPQKKIADRFGISRSYVSKLLLEAKEQGIVKIEIINPFELESPIENKIRSRFNLDKAIVVPVNTRDFMLKLEVIGESLSKYLYQIVEDNDIISVTWGITLNVCSSKLIKKPVKNCVVTQLNGGLARADKGVHVYEIINRFAAAFEATPYYLNVPAILDSHEIKDTIIKDRHISDVLSFAESSNIAIFAAGEFGFNSALVRDGYFSEDEIQALLKKGVVGDICARFIDINGNLVDSEFDKRVVGISLDSLRKKEYRILLSAEDEYISGTYGALSGGLANVLITDEKTADALMAYSDTE